MVKGLALQYRDSTQDFETYIKPAINRHRQQYHHRMWNQPHPDDKTEPKPQATEEDMLVGAVDATCSLLENRGYQGGDHAYDEVIEIAKENPPHKTPYMLEIIPEMRSMSQPGLEKITSVRQPPNIGLEKAMHDAITERTREAVASLRREHGYEHEDSFSKEETNP